SRLGGPEIWLLWVDDDWRTAAMASPDGRLGWIMERGQQTPDRQKAAREILNWMGFDLEKLRKVAP
ncbi:MAG: lipocalin, partial [Rhodobacteraceae bacterium]|nr:lipocalin [Paracoccaceae bacterium]